MITLGRYHDLIYDGDILSTLRDVQYIGGIP